jgi:hypothetical protein
MATTWIRHPTIAGASDDAVERAIIEHMGNSQFAPKLADIVGKLRQSSPVTTGQQGPKCLDCGGTGWAEGSALLVNGQIEGPFALVCGCVPRKGIGWYDWQKAMEKRTDVLKFWVTGRNQPTIPDEGRLTADQLAAREARKAKGKVLRFTPHPQDKHLDARQQTERQAKKEGWR